MGFPPWEDEGNDVGDFFVKKSPTPPKNFAGKGKVDGVRSAAAVERAAFFMGIL